MSHLRCQYSGWYFRIVLCKGKHAPDGPVNIDNCKTIAKIFKNGHRSGHKVLKSIEGFTQSRCWSALVYWFLALLATLRLVQD
jgi:hypothetical protein